MILIAKVSFTESVCLNLCVSVCVLACEVVCIKSERERVRDESPNASHYLFKSIFSWLICRAVTWNWSKFDWWRISNSNFCFQIKWDDLFVWCSSSPCCIQSNQSWWWAPGNVYSLAFLSGNEMKYLYRFTPIFHLKEAVSELERNFLNQSVEAESVPCLVLARDLHKALGTRKEYFS